MEIKTKMHTIFLMVGPTNCGKSHLSKMMQEFFNQKLENSCTVLSSDEIRRWLLGQHLDKYDKKMMHVSTQAFSILENNLINLMSYPVSKPFIIIDSTGLNKEFRDRIAGLAKDFHYNIEMVLFNYKKRDDFYKFSDSSNFVLNSHIKKLHKDVLPNLNKKSFKKINKVIKPLESLNLEISDLEDYQRCLFPEKKYHIFGDIHGCFDEFQSLLIKKGLMDDSKELTFDKDKEEIILVGDLIDKGPKSSELLSFVLKNKEYIKVVIGNHENFVYKFLSGEIKNTFDPSFLKENFSCSLDFSKKDLDNLEKIIENSYPFIKTIDGIITHAPCEVKYLGKVDSKSKQNQRNFFWEKRRKDFQSIDDYTDYKNKKMSFINAEANFSHPYHVFGHVAMKNVLKIKNKICLDTGAVHGNRLTSVVLGRKPYFDSIKSNSTYYKKELDNFFKKETTIDIENLEPREFGRIKHSCLDKINYVSGTVSPSNSDSKQNSLETLDTAFEYYKSKGVYNLMLQNKYMGSRCNLYIFEDIEKCFATSRNGFKIKTLDLSSVFKERIKLHKKEFKNNNTLMILEDGELMPWAALGKGLISNEFRTVGDSLEKELTLLKETGFEEQLNPLLDDFLKNKDNYIKDLSSLSGKNLDSKYGSQKYQSLKALRYLDWISLKEQENLIKIYNNQLDIFSQESAVHFKGFAILKQVFKDGSEKVWIGEDINTEEMFKKVSSDPYYIVDLNDSASVKEAQKFYDKNTLENNEEGVVVKPLKTFIPNTAPFLKVRNPQYLTLIYGFDYLHDKKLNKLIDKKNTKKKVSLSIKEYALGKKMLEIPFSEISLENNEYVQTLAKLILEEKKEKDLDPRL